MSQNNTIHNVTMSQNNTIHNATMSQNNKKHNVTISQNNTKLTMSQSNTIHNVTRSSDQYIEYIVHNTTQCHNSIQHRVSQNNTFCDRLGLTSDTHARRNTADSPESSVQIYISSIFGLDLRFPVPHPERLAMYVYQLLQSRIEACQYKLELEEGLFKHWSLVDRSLPSHKK